jgi:YceI-like protein
VTAVEERPRQGTEGSDMAGKPAGERLVAEHCDVVSDASSLTFFAMSSSNPVYGKATQLRGFIEVAWHDDGTIVSDPAPKMHVEFEVETLRTGNELQDREMWKLIDSKRFPKIAGDLLGLGPGARPGRYLAAGQITLAGLARRYEGEFTVQRDASHVTLDGTLNIDVRDFGLKPLKLLVLSVAPLVRVRVHLIAARTV